MKTLQTIPGRLFLIFLLSMVLLLIIVNVVYYNRAADQIRDKVGVISEKNISQTVGLFDLLLQGYDSVTKTLNSNVELVRLLQQHAAADSAAKPDIERRISESLGAIFYSRRDIVGIHIVSNNGKVFGFDRSSGATTSNYTPSDWLMTLMQSTGEMKWLGVFPQSLISKGINQPVFAFGRQLFELQTLKSTGIVYIETDANAIVSALSNASLGPGSLVMIRDNNGEEIVRTNTNVEGLPAVPKDWADNLRPNEVFVRKLDNTMVTAARIGMADWTMISVTPNRELQLELKETQQFLATFILILVAVAIIIATLVSRSFSKPFKRLIQQMKQVELGNFKGEVKVQSYQELNVLVNSFNRMVLQMDDLIERIKLASISEKQAQLQALQSQVNPHFLFNTLDMIYWMLDERENDRLGGVILALSRIFRYSSDWEEASLAALELELEQFRHYFTIIETRLGGRVSTSIEVGKRWLDVQVPKMILQPIVENAVKYGLEPMNRPGTLRVYSQEAAGKLEIVVEDDGVGVDEDTLQRIQSVLQSNEDAGLAVPDLKGRRGIGLLNVHRRIKLMFGDGYGLRFESRQNEGTKVIASFPIQHREDEQA
ncbi:sensor histidine kinase [Paenibacillus sp. HB172176]|uniref:sensor histidine kinase n=1 Tax=Paenibacillus sp. HB172176 TaxID=2493690 RepID=UPI00143C1B3F|nr:sensor histidine kinase [Paenibacillus sp. HB172176]